MTRYHLIMAIVFVVGLVASAEETARDTDALMSFTPPPGYQCRPIDTTHKVKRHHKKKPEPIVVTKEVVKQVPVDRVVEVPTLRYRNSVRLLVGMGPYMGGTLDKLPTQVSLGIDYLPVAGLGYDRRLNDRWSIGVQGFTNLMWNANASYHFDF